MPKTIDELQDDVRFFMHGVQTGVAIMQQRDTSCDPKHLRVGVNSALVNEGALTKVLVDKGIITDQEYFEALAFMWEREYDKYTAIVEKALGQKVKLA